MGLAAWERASDAQIQRLRERPEVADVVGQLLETSCLLELAKITLSQPDLPGFADQVVEVISQFYPVEACVLSVEATGLTPVRASFRSLPDDVLSNLTAQLVDPATSVARAGTVEALRLDIGPGAGRAILAVDGLPPLMTGAGFLSRVGEQIAGSARQLLESERLRRHAAVATANRLAASLDEGWGLGHLEDLARALAVLPGAAGARLAFRGSWLIDVLEVGAGDRRGPGETSVVGHADAEGDDTAIELTIHWLPVAGAHDRDALQQVLATLRESLGRVRRTRDLAERAVVDPLTGIGNRRKADEMLEKALELSRRERKKTAVVLFDLDHFKSVNDQLGHPVGDAVLERVGQLLRTYVRAYDTPARIGGEEFAVICPSTGEQAAVTLAERLRAALPEFCLEVLPDRRLQTASIGVVVFPDHADDVAELWRRADEALYAAKRRGRDRVVVAWRLLDPDVAEAIEPDRAAEPAGATEPAEPVRGRRGILPRRSSRVLGGRSDR